jgi:exodeoxyribonuclease V gamma subunit
VDVRLDDGTAIIGTVAGVRGDLIQTVTFSRLAPAHRLQAWLRLLALSAAHPEHAFQTEMIGKGEGSGLGRPRVNKSCIAGLGSTPDERRSAATRHLATIVDIFRRGMREPLPIYCRTSHSYAAAERRRENSWSTARNAWAEGLTREDNEAAHALVLGGVVAFDQVYDQQCGSDERGAGWPAGVTGRFAAYALRLWMPLLDAEEMSNK